MNPAEVAATQIANPAIAEITVWSMFWNAHIVVKFVMLGLLSASVWCWAIIVDKTLLFRRVRKAMERFEDSFWSGNSLEELYTKLSERPTIGNATLFVAAMREWKRSFQNAGASYMGLQARIEKVLDVSIVREVEKLESNLLVLATVASAGPFVGLFGTVWGILRAFQKIDVTGQATIQTVGGDISHALIATAVGLAAAIPAVMAFNYFNRRLRVLTSEMDNFSDDFLNIVKRHFGKR